MEFINKFLDSIRLFFTFFFTFKAYVMLPIIIFVFGIIIRMKIKDAFISALKLGVGFAGIFFVFNFFVENIKPAVDKIISARGLNFPILDVGWPPLAAITWTSIIASLIIPLFLLINIIMIATKTTRTINIDIWNYWHFALIGALIHKINNNLVLGLIATILIGIYSIKLSDWSTPYVQRECNIKGVTISPLSVVGLQPFAVLINNLLDMIPGIRKINYNAEEKNSKFSIFNEPMIIGAIVGLILGIIADYDIKKLLELSVNIAAVMYIIPHFGSLLGNGIEQVSIKLKESITKLFPNRDDLVIAMDAPVIMKNKSVIVTGLLLMPLSLGIAFILPGNKTIPLGDLPNLISVMSVIVLVSRSNVIRGVLIGIPIVTTYLLVASHFAPLFTELANQAGVNYSRDITAFTDGGNQIRFWFYYMFKGNIIALAIIPVVLALLFLSWKNYKKAMIEINETEEIK